MTFKEIRDEAWAIAREVSTSDVERLWPLAEMNRYINRTYRTVARETRCIRDSVTSSVCRISCAAPADLATLTTLAAADSWYAQDLTWYNDSNSWLYQQLVAPYSYPLSPYIIEIEEAKWSTQDWRLTKVSVEKWRVNTRWEQMVHLPTEYATDGDNGRLFLNARPLTADTLRLTVVRYPLADLVLDTDTPEYRWPTRRRWSTGSWNRCSTSGTRRRTFRPSPPSSAPCSCATWTVSSTRRHGWRIGCG